MAADQQVGMRSDDGAAQPRQSVPPVVSTETATDTSSDEEETALVSATA